MCQIGFHMITETCTLSLDFTVSDYEFKSMMAATVKKFCLAVVLVFLVTILKGLLLVSLSLIVKNPSVAAISYRPFRVLKTSIILPLSFYRFTRGLVVSKFEVASSSCICVFL